MPRRLSNIFRRQKPLISLTEERKQRFDNFMSERRHNFLKNIYQRLFDIDDAITEREILDAYSIFSDKIQTNTFAAAEIEWVAISVLCYYRPGLTEFLMRRGLLYIVWSLGDDIDSFTVLQFIERRIFADNADPSGGWPPEPGMKWLQEILPTQKETIQKVLDDAIKENRIELDKI